MPRLLVATENGSPVELHYDDVGAGPPVVFVSAWPLSGRSLEPQVAPLVQAGHRVVTYDRRGFGASSQPWSGYDYDTLAGDLRALLEHLDLADVTLAGLSMGGGEVVRYLSTHGTGRVRRAVLASAAPPYLRKTADNPDGGLDDATIEQFLDGVRTDRIAFLDEFTTEFFTAAGGELQVSEAQRRYARHSAEFASPRGTAECIRTFSCTDFRAELPALDLPVLVLHGDADAVAPFEVSGKRSHAMIRGSELVLVEGGPHGLNISHAEQFNRALLDFVGR